MVASVYNRGKSSVQIHTVILTLMLAGIGSCTAESDVSESSHPNQCVCPGDTITYNCTAIGTSAGFTVWTGTALDCIGNEITLLHSHFMTEGGDSGECNDGAIVARSLGVEGNNYSSQLSVTLTPDISCKTITCIYDSGTSTDSRLVAEIPKSGPLSPPSILHTSDVNFASKEITFKWSPVALSCPAISYGILSSNCGSCPTTTTNTTVTCTDAPTNGSVCTFAVQTITCGLAGNMTNIISVHLADVDTTILLIREGASSCTGLTVSTSVLAVLLVRRGKLDSLFIVAARMDFLTFSKFFIFHILLL